MVAGVDVVVSRTVVSAAVVCSVAVVGVGISPRPISVAEQVTVVVI